MIAIRTSRRRSPLEIWRNVDRRKPANVEYCRAQGIVGFWMCPPWLRGTNRFYDLVGMNHGTLTNMDPATDWVNTQHGPVLDFDASNDSVAATVSIASASKLSLIGDIYRSNTGHTCGWGYSNGSTVGSAGGPRFSFIWFSDGNLYVNCGNASNGANGVVALAGTGSHHVVASYDGGGATNAARLQVYVDGVPQSLSYNATIQTTALTGLSAFTLGKDSSNRFTGGRIQHAILRQDTTPVAEASFFNDQFRRGFPDMLNRWRRKSYFIPPAASPWLYARRQSRIIGGGVL